MTGSDADQRLDTRTYPTVTWNNSGVPTPSLSACHPAAAATR